MAVYSNGILTNLRLKQAVKPDDETVNNDTSLQNDDDLFFAIGANETWSFNLWLRITTGSTPDFKYAFTLPSGAVVTATEITSLGTTHAVLSDLTTARAAASSGSLFHIWVEGIIINSSTAGTVQLQWAQNTQDASNTVVEEGSFLIARRVN